MDKLISFIDSNDSLQIGILVSSIALVKQKANGHWIIKDKAGEEYLCAVPDLDLLSEWENYIEEMQLQAEEQQVYKSNSESFFSNLIGAVNSICDSLDDISKHIKK